MHMPIAKSINGATVIPSVDKCAASPTSLVGKTVKSVGKAAIRVGSDDIAAVTITFSDGTRAAAAVFQGGLANSVKGASLLQVEPNGCQYSLT